MPAKVLWVAVGLRCNTAGGTLDDWELSIQRAAVVASTLRTGAEKFS